MGINSGHVLPFSQAQPQVTRTITSMNGQSKSFTAAQHEFPDLKGAVIMKICFQVLFVEEIVWEVYIS